MTIIKIELELVENTMFTSRRITENFTSTILLKFDKGWRVATFGEWNCLVIVEVDVVSVAEDVLVWGYT
jgi:hypothetical protein